ncbi:unnamed protein product [Enterobius vermicularis]|uniref:G_PROTEIN_RECEP_F1_2 domain-containing protein n=1 Tax=Enterobius vermicularis TaxID=51028 RepID=A0A0N4VLE2_ENTVE|nr:unnamed protein product [Enterobius vermicularis]
MEKCSRNLRNHGITNTSLVYDVDPTIDFHIYRRSCLLNAVPAFNVVGAQWQAMLVGLTGLERVYAYFCPIQYYKLRRTIPYLLTGPLVLLSLAAGILTGLFFIRNITGPFLCTLSTAYGGLYGIFHYTVVIGVTVVGFICTTLVKILIMRARNHVTKDDEAASLRAAALVAIFSLLFVCVPNVLILCLRSHLRSESMVVLSAYTNCFFCARALLDVVVYLIVDVEYQRFVIKWLQTARRNRAESSKCI